MSTAGFFQAPNNITTLAPRVGYAAAWVYVLLLRHAGSSGRCWPKQETLAVESGLCVMTVRRAIERLEAEGLISVERTGRANVFTLHLMHTTEQSDAHHRTISGEMNNQMHTTEQSDSTVGTIRNAPPSSPPSLLPPDPHSLNPPIIPPHGEKESRKRNTKEGAFAPPSLAEVENFFLREIKPELRGSMADAESFVEYWTNRDWRFDNGRGAKMKDWRLTACAWMRRKPEYSNGVQNGHAPPDAKPPKPPPKTETPEEIKAQQEKNAAEWAAMAARARAKGVGFELPELPP